jgi:hypothetical protein
MATKNQTQAKAWEGRVTKSLTRSPIVQIAVRALQKKDALVTSARFVQIAEL